MYDKRLVQVAAVTQAVDSQSVSELLFLLEEPLLSFEGVDTSMIQSYLSALQALRAYKKDAALFCSVLTHAEIQHCISQVFSISSSKVSPGHLSQSSAVLASLETSVYHSFNVYLCYEAFKLVKS